MINAANFKDQSICILGLGYVGLTLATAMADVGFNVTGVEIRDDVLEKLARGEPHFHEPGLKEQLQRVLRLEKFRCVKRIPKDTEATVFIVTVGTPLGADNKVRLDMIESVSREISQHLKASNLVIMRSTVMIGTTRKVVLPILKESNVHFELAFCPERTLEGKALKELRQLPQIVGGSSLEATVRASQIFQALTPTVVRVDDLETAEMVKLVDNAQRDVFFAYSNEVARMCDAVGISAAQVISAGKLGYPRTNLAMPGPVGGPCLEKDPHILAEGLRQFNVRPDITLAARHLNADQPRAIVKYLKKTVVTFPGFPLNPNISLLGIAFKGQPVTDDLRGTMARPIFAALKAAFPTAHFRGYDSVVSRAEIKNFGLEPVSQLSDAFRDSSLVLILNNHVDFANMPIEDLSGKMARPGLVYDFWNNFNASDLYFSPDLGYMALGSHGCAILPGRKF